MYYMDWLEEFIKHRDKPPLTSAAKNRLAATKTEDSVGAGSCATASDDDDDIKPPTMHSYGLEAPKTSSATSRNNQSSSSNDMHGDDEQQRQQRSPSGDDYKVYVVNTVSNGDHHHMEDGENLMVATEENSNASSVSPSNVASSKKWCPAPNSAVTNTSRNTLMSSNNPTNGTTDTNLSSSRLHEHRVFRPTSRNISLYNKTQQQTSNSRYSSSHAVSSEQSNQNYRQVPSNVIPLLNHKLSERSSSSNIVTNRNHQNSMRIDERERRDHEGGSLSKLQGRRYSLSHQHQQQSQNYKQMDDFDIFGRYIASKMRKLGHRISEEDMEDLEFDILNTLERKRYDAAGASRRKPATATGSTSLTSSSRKRDYQQSSQQPSQTLIEVREEDSEQKETLRENADSQKQQRDSEDDSTTTVVVVDDDLYRQSSLSPSNQDS